MSAKIPLDRIISKIYRDLDLPDGFREQDFIEWIGEALKKLNVTDEFETPTVPLQIVDYRARWPKGFYQIDMVMYNGEPLKYGSGIFPPNTELHCNNSVSLHTRNRKDYYTVNSYFISTSFKTGTIYLKYYKLPVDERGFPLVPNDPMYAEALMHYVEMKLARPQWKKGKIPDHVYRKIENDWGDYATAASNSSKMPDVNEAESIKSMLMRTMFPQNSYDNFFADTINDDR